MKVRKVKRQKKEEKWSMGIQKNELNHCLEWLNR